MRKLTGLVVILAAVTITVPARAFELYRIVAEDCRGGQSATFQTGFSYEEGSEIITALHGVLDCAKISGQHFVGQTRQTTISSLSIAHVDVERDLAILSEPSLRSVTETQPNYPNSDAELKITGFPQGSSMPDTIGVKLGEPGIRSLRSILRAKDVLRYEQIGSPSPNVNIIRLDGNAQIGHSGAPLTDLDGTVLGVVIGGYGLGEFGTFWAIPISEITWSSAGNQELERVTSLRGQFSTPIEAPIAVARLALFCGSEVADGELSLSLSSEEFDQVAQFAAVLDENKDRFIYAQVSIRQDGCLACACQRELDHLDDLPLDFPGFEFGWVKFNGVLDIDAGDAHLVPTLWREGYRIDSFVPEFGTTTTFALPLPRHLERSQYRFEADRFVRLGFDGIFVAREHFQTGWHMFHLEPTEIPTELQERLLCIRDHVGSGRTDQAAGWC